MIAPVPPKAPARAGQVARGMAPGGTATKAKERSRPRRAARWKVLRALAIMALAAQPLLSAQQGVAIRQVDARRGGAPLETNFHCCQSLGIQRHEASRPTTVLLSIPSGERGTHGGLGAAIGAGVGVVTGVVYGLTYDASEDSPSPAVRALLAAGLFGLGGAGIGFVIGSLFPRDTTAGLTVGVRLLL